MVAVGNTRGGRYANRNPLNSLIKMFSLLILALLFLFVAIVIKNSLMGLLATILLGLFAFMNVPGLLLYVVQLAKKYVPTYITSVSAFNIAAFNIGIFLGSSIGAQITRNIDLVFTQIGGSILVFLGLILVFVVRKSEKI